MTELIDLFYAQNFFFFDSEMALDNPEAPLDYMFVFMPVKYCFNYCSFATCFEIRMCDASSFALCQSHFNYPWYLVVSCEF